jgi:hypothetical protein
MIGGKPMNVDNINIIDFEPLKTSKNPLPILLRRRSPTISLDTHLGRNHHRLARKLLNRFPDDLLRPIGFRRINEIGP